VADHMTSRERVVATLNHQEPDRVPIDFGSNFNTGVNVIAYNRLKKHLGIRSPTHSRYVIPMLAAPELDDGLEMLQRMGGDVLPLPRLFVDGMASKDWKPWTLKDGSVCLVPGKFNPEENEDGALDLVFQGVPQFRMPKDGHYFDRIFTPLSSVESLRQLEEILPVLRTHRAFNWADAELEVMAEWGRRAHEETDYAILGDPYTLSFYQPGFELFGYEKFFVFLAAEPEIVHCWMDFLAESHLANLAHYLEAVGDYIQVIIMVDDYGQQKGPQISTRMFQEYFKPCMTRICDLVHERCPHLKVLLHSCGSIVPLIPEFIEAGIDALNPVQITAEHMDPAVLKREFGEHIAFWGGGIGTQTTLCHGTPDDVREEVKSTLEIFKPGGGYVFTPDHNIQENISPEKILAVYKTAQEFGRY
jgi:uroporphyrinogen decarboxylase